MVAPVLTGQRVHLRPLMESDLQARLKHGWHAEIELNYGTVLENREMTEGEAKTWFEHLTEKATNTFWMIQTEDELAGVTFLHSLDAQSRKARFAIGLFAPGLIGQGLGSEATQLVLDHAFNDLELHRIDLRVLAFNKQAIASYQKCGFQIEGRERDSCWLDGHWHDDLIMAILKPDYLARTGSK